MRHLGTGDAPYASCQLVTQCTRQQQSRCIPARPWTRQPYCQWGWPSDWHSKTCDVRSRIQRPAVYINVTSINLTSMPLSHAPDSCSSQSMAADMIQPSTHDRYHPPQAHLSCSHMRGSPISAPLGRRLGCTLAPAAHSRSRSLGCPALWSTVRGTLLKLARLRDHTCPPPRLESCVVLDSGKEPVLMRSSCSRMLGVERCLREVFAWGSAAAMHSCWVVGPSARVLPGSMLPEVLNMAADMLSMLCLQNEAHCQAS